MTKERTFTDGIVTAMMLLVGIGLLYVGYQEWNKIALGLGYAFMLVLWGFITYLAQHPTKEMSS